MIARRRSSPASSVVVDGVVRPGMSKVFQVVVVPKSVCNLPDFLLGRQLALRWNGKTGCEGPRVDPSTRCAAWTTPVAMQGKVAVDSVGGILLPKTFTIDLINKDVALHCRFHTPSCELDFSQLCDPYGLVDITIPIGMKTLFDKHNGITLEVQITCLPLSEPSTPPLASTGTLSFLPEEAQSRHGKGAWPWGPAARHREQNREAPKREASKRRQRIRKQQQRQAAENFFDVAVLLTDEVK